MTGKRRRPAEKNRDLINISKLYIAGKDQMTIAEMLGISQPTVSRGIKELQKEWAEERVNNIDEAKKTELAKIDHLELLYLAGWQRSLNDSVKETSGKMSTGDVDYTVTEAQSGDPRFLDGAMNCVKQRCAILGVEAPKKTEHSGEIKTDLKVDDERFNTAIASLTDAVRERISDKASGKKS